MEPSLPTSASIALCGVLCAALGLVGSVPCVVVWSIASAVRTEMLGSEASAGTRRGD